MATLKIEKQKEMKRKKKKKRGSKPLLYEAGTEENRVFLLLNFEIRPAMLVLSEEGPFLFQPLQVLVTYVQVKCTDILRVFN